MEIPKIHESEYRFCLIMWEHEDVYKRQDTDSAFPERYTSPILSAVMRICVSSICTCEEIYC